MLSVINFIQNLITLLLVIVITTGIPMQQSCVLDTLSICYRHIVNCVIFIGFILIIYLTAYLIYKHLKHVLMSNKQFLNIITNLT